MPSRERFCDSLSSSFFLRTCTVSSPFEQLTLYVLELHVDVYVGEAFGAVLGAEEVQEAGLDQFALEFAH